MSRPRNKRQYGWAEVQRELEHGIHPAVVAARLGEPEFLILETAEQQGWAVSYRRPSPDQILAAYDRAGT